MSEEENIKNLLKDYFSQKSDIDTVLLFGSFAKGSYNSHSDVDIAIHSHLPLDYEKLSQIQTELSLLCHREIDLADLSKAEGIFLYQIMTTGIKIKINPTVFVNHLSKALCFKEDFLPVIEFSRKEKIRRFING
ncbi:MAG: nucleotidyltransferase domain-containing protein [Treponema sp.]|nr:nucleotidyltransferase domain-containing protein [Treponema sp.]